MTNGRQITLTPIHRVVNQLGYLNNHIISASNPNIVPKKITRTIGIRSNPANDKSLS